MTLKDIILHRLPTYYGLVATLLLLFTTLNHGRTIEHSSSLLPNQPHTSLSLSKFHVALAISTTVATTTVNNNSIKKNKNLSNRLNDIDQEGIITTTIAQSILTESRSWRRETTEEECSNAHDDDDDAKVVLELSTDYYPSEILWDIQDIDGNIIKSGNAFTYNSFTTYNYTYCINKNGCYSFNMYDY